MKWTRKGGSNQESKVLSPKFKVFSAKSKFTIKFSRHFLGFLPSFEIFGGLNTGQADTSIYSSHQLLFAFGCQVPGIPR